MILGLLLTALAALPGAAEVPVPAVVSWTVGIENPAPDSVFLGRVVEAGSGRPVPAATVLLLDADGNRRAGAFTAGDGTFRLSAAPAPPTCSGSSGWGT
jgi:hypothetical protein